MQSVVPPFFSSLYHSFAASCSTSSRIAHHLSSIPPSSAEHAIIPRDQYRECENTLASGRRVFLRDSCSVRPCSCLDEPMRAIDHRDMTDMARVTFSGQRVKTPMIRGTAK